MKTKKWPVDRIQRYMPKPQPKKLKRRYTMVTKFKFYSQEKSMKNIKSSVFSGFMYIATERHRLWEPYSSEPGQAKPENYV